MNMPNRICFALMPLSHATPTPFPPAEGQGVFHFPGIIAAATLIVLVILLGTLWQSKSG